MSPEDRDDFKDRDVWRRYRGSKSPPDRTRCPAELDLAEYLDGKAPAEAAESMEAHLVQCMDCSSALVELRALLRERAEPVPGTLVAKVVALVPAKAVSAPMAPPTPRRLTSPWLARRVRNAGWGALAAALLGAAYLGYSLGSLSCWQYQLTQTTFPIDSNLGMPALTEPESVLSVQPGVFSEVTP